MGRLIETNADDSSITVTWAGEDGETADDEDSKALPSKLRVERTFQMPSTADLASAEVTIDGRRVTVTASDKDKTAPKGMRPSSPISIVDGERRCPCRLRSSECVRCEDSRAEGVMMADARRERVK